MTKQELTEQIWEHPDSKSYRNDWQRWTTSGYHITSRMDLSTIIESALEMTDLGLPKFYIDDQTVEVDILEEDLRKMYYEEAESPEVLSVLAKKLWDRTPRDLRPEPEPSSWLMATEVWWKEFTK